MEIPCRRIVLLHAKSGAQGLAFQSRGVEGTRCMRRFGTTSFLRATKSSKPPLNKPQRKPLEYKYVVHSFSHLKLQWLSRQGHRLASLRAPPLQNRIPIPSATAQFQSSPAAYPPLASQPIYPTSSQLLPDSPTIQFLPHPPRKKMSLPAMTRSHRALTTAWA